MNSNDKAAAAWNDFVYDNQEEEIKELRERIKRLEEAGDAMAQNHNAFTFIDWDKAKEAK